MSKAATLIDKEDEHILTKYTFRIKPCRNTSYLITSINHGPRGERKQITQGLHRLILGLKPGDGKIVDHINGNGMDNRKSNLRLCDNKTNGQNRKINKNLKSSKFKGVHWSSRNKKWMASIRINKKLFRIGLFEDERKAALAYDKKAKSEFGSYARTNL